MRFEVSQADYQIFVSVLTLFREKGGRNVKITRNDILRESGISKGLFSRKILNSYKHQKILEENVL